MLKNWGGKKKFRDILLYVGYIERTAVGNTERSSFLYTMYAENT
jgi:hypothetical protein